MGIRVALILGVLVWRSGIAGAVVPYTVDTTADSGAGSLRQAILDANGSGSEGLVRVQVTGTITLLTPLAPVTVPLTINGPGASMLTIQAMFPGAAGAAVLTATNSTSLRVSGVTITGGVNNSGNGGGIHVVGATLQVLDSVISGNAAMQGSGIYTEGPILIRNSTISDNTGLGAIYFTAGGSINLSTIENNHGTAIVFALAAPPLVNPPSLSIDSSTVSGNDATSGVGGIGGLALQAGTATITTSTWSGNTGTLGGDFWTASDGVTLSLSSVTAMGGGAPALLLDHTATVQLKNTLIAGSGTRCSAAPTTPSLGNNLSSDATCGFTAVTDKSGVDPLLGPLAANGGATKTHLLLADSPAANAGGATDATVDQRGYPRKEFDAVDIGAVEITAPAISQQPVAQQLVAGEVLTLSVVAHNQNSATALSYQWRKDGAPIVGGTEATFTKLASQVSDAGLYDVLVINNGGGLPSAAVQVTVDKATGTDGGIGGSAGGDGGGCCSVAGGGGWSSGMLGLLVVGLLGYRRRSRAANHRHAG